MCGSSPSAELFSQPLTGGFETRPYEQYAMDMIGHDDKITQVYMRIMTGESVPAIDNNFSVLIEMHLTMCHVPQ
jgi:hypothetical protein